MKRRQFLTSAAASLACGLALRPALAQPAVGGGDARVLRFVPESGLTNPDPVWTTTTTARNHAYMIWDTLYGQTSEGVPAPQMAAGHELSDDRLTWRFTLRDGLLFHDGERVLARDCVPSILRWARRRGFGQKLLTQLNEIRALDDQRFEIRLTRPYPLMLEALGTDSCFIMPERISRTDPFTQISEYVGSGPFRFVPGEFIPGSRAAYTRFDRYQPLQAPPDFTSGGKVAEFDRVEWIVMSDPTDASTALRNGQVDWWQNPLVDLLPQLRQADGVNVLTNDTVGVIAMMAFNHVQPPFNNPKLLRALLPAVDQDAFMQAAMGSEPDLYHVPVGAFTPGLSMANDSGIAVLKGPRNPDLARRLVAESGYAGEKVVLMAPSDYPLTQALCQVARDLFEQLGLQVEYQSMDWATLLQRRTSRDPVDKGGWSSFCTTYEGLSLATPASHVPLRGNGFGAWFGWPKSPRIEALRDAWFDAPDLAGRRQLAKQIQLAVWEEVPYIPLGQWFLPTATRNNVHDVVKAPFPIFWGVRKS
jgi:peptide/nickel transport system substrate-binding protein